ncbi:lithostathine-like [Lytechinus variegatus]|uniref:lithostathine-like n=1 Tax=Lytechinus variegatus TaxID=7654 RepID=UPI001BB2B7AE|nr:lithostathine-like [Lytechinus variegatus]
MRTFVVSIFLLCVAGRAYGQAMPGQSMYPMEGCAPGWTNFGKFCYKYFWERLPFMQAQIKCLSFRASPLAPRGYLVTAKDQQHNRFQHNFLRFTGGGNNKVWMGLAERRYNEFWWADGTPFHPHDWNLFKPDQPQQNHHIDGVHTFDNYPYQTWVTSSHETQMSFICQYKYLP